MPSGSDLRRWQWPALAGLAALMVVLALLRHSPSLVGGRDQLVVSYPAAELRAGRTLAQSVQIGGDHVRGVWLWLYPGVHPSDHPVQVSLWDGDRLLTQATRPASALDRTGPTFFPLAVSAGRANGVSSFDRWLVLTIAAPDLPAGERVTVMGGPNRYPNSALLVNGRPQMAIDLAFELVYDRPAIAVVPAVALGKPGLLGSAALLPALLLLLTGLLGAAGWVLART